MWSQALVQDLGGHDDIEPAPTETDDDPVAPPAEREARRQASPPSPATAAAGEDAIPEDWKAERRRPVHRRPRPAGRGRRRDAGAASRQARPRHRASCRTQAVSRSAIFSLDMTGRADGRASATSRSAARRRICAICCAACSRSAEGADPRRSLAGGGCGAEKRDDARNARRGLLRLVAAGRGGAVPEGRKRRGEIAGAGQFAECRARQRPPSDCRCLHEVS